jgi:hypothetical protein
MAALANYYKKMKRDVTEVLYLSEGLGATLINFKSVHWITFVSSIWQIINKKRKASSLFNAKA